MQHERKGILGHFWRAGFFDLERRISLAYDTLSGLGSLGRYHLFLLFYRGVTSPLHQSASYGEQNFVYS
jgi:hypothetical protein